MIGFGCVNLHTSRLAPDLKWCNPLRLGWIQCLLFCIFLQLKVTSVFVPDLNRSTVEFYMCFTPNLIRSTAECYLRFTPDLHISLLLIICIFLQSQSLYCPLRGSGPKRAYLIGLKPLILKLHSFARSGYSALWKDRCARTVRRNSAHGYLGFIFIEKDYFLKDKNNIIPKKGGKKKENTSEVESNMEIISRTEIKYEDTKDFTRVAPEIKWGELYLMIRDHNIHDDGLEEMFLYQNIKYSGITKAATRS